MTAGNVSGIATPPRLEFPAVGPTIATEHGQVPSGVMLVDAEAVVSDRTVRGPNVAAAFVLVGGAPTLDRVVNELEGDFSGRPHTAIAVLQGAGGTIRESLLEGPVWHIDALPMPEYEGITGSGRIIAEDNVGDMGFGLGVTDGSAFLRNTVGGIELGLLGGGSVLIEGRVLAVSWMPPCVVMSSVLGLPLDLEVDSNVKRCVAEAGRGSLDPRPVGPVFPVLQGRSVRW